MKFRLLIILSIIGCSTQEQELVTKKSNHHIISIEHPPVLNNEIEYFEIPIKNENSVPVTLPEKMVTSCTCMAYQLDSRILQPNEQTILRLKAHLNERQGPFTMIVTFVDSLDHVWQLKSTTFVYRRHQLDGDNLEFGATNKGQEFIRNLIYKQAASTTNDLPSIPKLETKIAGLELIDTESKIEKLTDRLTVRTTNFKFKVIITSESFNNYIKFTSDKQSFNDAWQNAKISWKIKYDIEAYPDELYLPITNSKTIQRKIYLRFHKNFTNLEVKSSNRSVTCELVCNDNKQNGFLTITIDTTTLTQYDIIEHIKFTENGQELPNKITYKLIK